jgi:hypothetical protein
MKKDKDISLSLSRSDERLGNVLSRGLAQSKTGETGHCLEPELIAAVVEGTVTGEERDRILRHISACDTCYEMFLLTSELQEEGEIRQETHKILRLKPLALAASVLIVIFSIYIFFRSEEIPKTSNELLEKSDTSKDSREKFLQTQPATESPKSKMVFAKEKEEKKIADHKLAAPPREYRSKKIEAKASAKPMLEPKKETTRDKDKQIEKKEADIRVGEGIRIEREKREEVKAPTLPQKGVDEARFKMRASKSKAIDRKRAGERYKKMEMATQMVETEEAQQSPYLVVGQAVPVQYQAVQLNQVGQRFDNYIPQKDLGNLFKESIVLSQQLGKEFETVQTEAYKTGKLNEIDSYVKGLEPMITVKVIDDKTYISPNVEWFFSKSTPQSIEYQFFSLARSGWCDNTGLCYEGIKGVRHQLIRKTRQKGKVSESEDTVRRLLVKWKALHPQLSGIFKEVSTNTITHLKVSK